MPYNFGSLNQDGPQKSGGYVTTLGSKVWYFFPHDKLVSLKHTENSI